MKNKNVAVISGKKRTILIVEDNNELRDMLCGHLEDHFNIIPAATGEEALKLIASTFVIDLLITDFDLCGRLDGLDVARAMDAKIPKAAPIILATGSNVTMPRIRDLLSLRNTWLLEKPFEIPYLDQTIRSVIGASGDMKM